MKLTVTSYLYREIDKIKMIEWVIFRHWNFLEFNKLALVAGQNMSKFRKSKFRLIEHEEGPVLEYNYFDLFNFTIFRVKIYLIFRYILLFQSK